MENEWIGRALVVVIPFVVAGLCWVIWVSWRHQNERYEARKAFEKRLAESEGIRLEKTEPPPVSKNPKRGHVVFISGPMSTDGEPGENLNAASCAAAQALELGWFPIVPHTAWILHAIRPDVDLELWKEWSLAMVRISDAVVRLPGRSIGADSETKFAKALGIPVVKKISDLDGFFL